MVRPLRRLHRDLDRGLKLFDSTWRAISAATASRPIRTSRRLYRASFGLLEATQRWVDLAGELAVMSNHLYGLHGDVHAGLKSGELVPELAEPPCILTSKGGSELSTPSSRSISRRAKPFDHCSVPNSYATSRKSGDAIKLRLRSGSGPAICARANDRGISSSPGSSTSNSRIGPTVRVHDGGVSPLRNAR
ncbi:MAG TPA: hypothetical protein VFV49_04620, partial [Thermoanaerobaculia bacterium]|nr:hypothetical protein [Thermoanaerobaculia bacterium]